MKVSVKLTRTEKRKLSRLKREMKSAQKKLVRTYESMEKAWRKGKNASATVTKNVTNTVKQAKKATNETVVFFNKMKRKYRA